QLAQPPVVVDDEEMKLVVAHGAAVYRRHPRVKAVSARRASCSADAPAAGPYARRRTGQASWRSGMDTDAKKTALRMIPYGIYVMTASGDDGAVSAATVNWV